MMDVPTELLAQLGMGAIFLYLFLRKDTQLKELNDNVLSSYERNTKSYTELAESIKNNTEATKQTTNITNEIWRQLVRDVRFNDAQRPDRSK